MGEYYILSQQHLGEKTKQERGVLEELGRLNGISHKLQTGELSRKTYHTACMLQYMFADTDRTSHTKAEISRTCR